MNPTWAALVLVALTGGAAQAAFQDPLDVPAQISVQTQRGRTLAVKRAGEKLVAVGAKGLIQVSTDGGRQWRQVPCPVSTDLVALNFASPKLGWAVGHDGVVLHTADAGEHWVRQLDGRALAEQIKARLVQLEADPASDPKLKAEVSAFVAEGAAKPLLDVHFLNEQEGFIVGAFNLALRTVDGGKRWVLINDLTRNPEGLHLYAMAHEGSTLYVAGERGLLRRWRAELGRFDALTVPYGGSLFGVVARAGELVVFGMRGQAWRSVDAGQSWKRLAVDTTASLVAGTWLADGRLALVSQSGQLFVGKPGDAQLATAPTQHPMPYFDVSAAQPGAVALAGWAGVTLESTP